MARGLVASLALVAGGHAMKVPITGITNIRTDNCRCLNFKEVYSSGQAKCGDALEGYTYTREQGKNVEPDGHWCAGASVYSNLDSDACVKVVQKSTLPENATHFSDGAWCYVKAECTDLNGGQPVNSKVSWKSCTPGAENFLADLSGEVMFYIAKGNNIDAGLLVQMAYGNSPTAYGRGPVTKEKLRETAKIPAGTNRGKLLCTEAPATPELAQVDPCGVGEQYVVDVEDKVWCVDCGMCQVGDDGKPHSCMAEH